MEEIDKLKDLCITNEEECNLFNEVYERVKKYGLFYEVFGLAYRSLGQNPTKLKAWQAIEHQMYEWDL